MTGPLSQENVAQGAGQAVVAVRGAEVALCWACSGLGRGTAHPGFHGNHPINSPFSFLDSQLAKKNTPKAFLKMALAHECLLEHVHEEVLGLALLRAKPTWSLPGGNVQEVGAKLGAAGSMRGSQEKGLVAAQGMLGAVSPSPAIAGDPDMGCHQ